MLKTLIRLPDGTEISSGATASMNIRSCTTTHCVNSGEELTLGSVCAACAEIVIQAPYAILSEENVFLLYKVDDAGNETKIGIFNVKTAENKGEQLYKITAYDNVTKLDVDLTDWFVEYMVAIPQSPIRVIDDVCEQCGVRVRRYPNWSVNCHGINRFEINGTVTGRKIFQWIAEMLCCFCIADSDGNICFRWYEDNRKVVLSKGGERYRMQGSYKFKGHICTVDRVVIILAGGIPFTAGSADYECCYIIKSNPILDAKDYGHVQAIANDILAKLRTEANCFSNDDYLIACEVSTPATLDVNAGDIIVVDEQEAVQGEANVSRLIMRVMTKIQSGQKDTLKCTGSYRRR